MHPVSTLLDGCCDLLVGYFRGMKDTPFRGAKRTRVSISGKTGDEGALQRHISEVARSAVNEHLRKDLRLGRSGPLVSSLSVTGTIKDRRHVPWIMDGWWMLVGQSGVLLGRHTLTMSVKEDSVVSL